MKYKRLYCMHPYFPIAQNSAKICSNRSRALIKSHIHAPPPCCAGFPVFRFSFRDSFLMRHDGQSFANAFSIIFLSEQNGTTRFQ